MVSRESQLGATVTDGRQGLMAHPSTKTIVKETQREVNGAGTPRQSKKEGPTKAQDVAELKDYVRKLKATYGLGNVCLIRR
jgi:hypothetical protein